MTDLFKTHITSMRDPIETAQEVVPSDSSDLSLVTRAMYVGVAGDLRVTLLAGTTVTFAVSQGWHPIRTSRIWATGTTAGSIVACA